MIQVKGLSKKIGNKQILNDVHLTIPKGAIYGIIGVNGAGKTTLIRHMVGAYKPDLGYVEIEGSRVYENALTKQRLVYIPDEFPMTFGSKIADIVTLYRSIYPNFDMDRYQSLMEVFQHNHLDDFMNYSKGMKKQVLFILALSIRPEYLIMDEPFDGLDPQIRKKVWDILIQDVTDNVMTIFISSHHLYELDTMCDHIALLHDGKIVFERALEDLKNAFHKYQVVFKEEETYQQVVRELNIVDSNAIGRIHTFIVEGDIEIIEPIIDAHKPIVKEFLPLRLEEIFLFTLGGVDDAIKEIVD